MLTPSDASNLVMPSDRPLVLLFAGPSGHGKTELAQNLGRLISLDLHMVDCTTIKQETDLFGPRYPYVGYSEGSPLNNFLSDHTGTRSIVFLDEFEKTGQDIRETLLIPFQSGRLFLVTHDMVGNNWFTLTMLTGNCRSIPGPSQPEDAGMLQDNLDSRDQCF